MPHKTSPSWNPKQKAINGLMFNAIGMVMNYHNSYGCEQIIGWWDIMTKP
jgi:hypothetical protein